MRSIYRGYEVEKGKDQWDIYLYDEHVCSQPSEDFAYKWIDQEKKKERDLKALKK